MMLKQSALACVTVLTALTLGSLPLVAQTPTTTEGTPTTERRLDRSVLIDLNRAKNLARQAAERANGGLGFYRAESSMHGPAAQSPYVDNGNGTWTFTFRGTMPGETIPSYESVVTVSTEGNVTMDYNGPVRASTP
ncbi:hypothetical protein [Allocoleopsis franciscana]|uniref:Uncharacterized protein n=1 Tax=Allocoleopsis franciscana PCC 7113 TaxID=1173027 RepID=K9W989_9CYAN|nr:hypothetical protein [Allocoleopsis franciscana]AFZ16334.1 hypothetical protein Mic7113_0414 [Allocoleopsis franciscana PCC 7113]